ncbi:hypothetical protein KUCAC02_030301, partial [Chaenocephalus aceratus]
VTSMYRSTFCKCHGVPPCTMGPCRCLCEEEVIGTWCRLGSLLESEGRGFTEKPLFAACCHALSWNSICSLTGMKWHRLLAQMSGLKEELVNKEREEGDAERRI